MIDHHLINLDCTQTKQNNINNLNQIETSFRVKENNLQKVYDENWSSIETFNEIFIVVRNSS